eukprot:Selendium_serpulae@DN6011_c0_g1_i2.p1
MGLPTTLRVLRFEQPAGPMATDDDIGETAQDFEEECLKHGEVLHVRAVRRDEAKSVPFSAAGDVFVEFRVLAAARNCLLAMSGRFFDGRRLAVHYFEERLFRCSVKAL